jgi:plastocyanin
MKKFQNLGLSITLCSLLLFSFYPADAKKWVVTVKNYSFTPYNLTHVRAHDTIQWVWENGSHSTTSTSVPPGAESWDYPINQDTTSFMYIPTDNGTFFYSSTPDSAMGMNGQFTVTGANGVDEPGEKIAGLVYPNPFHDQVFIHNSSNGVATTRVLIYNSGGDLLRTVAFDQTSGRTSRVIKVADLPRGLFIFRIEDENQGISTHKAIHD